MENETTVRKRFTRSERKEHICSAIPILSHSRVPRRFEPCTVKHFQASENTLSKANGKAAKNANAEI